MTPIRDLPEGAEIHGIPVVSDSRGSAIAHATGVWPFKKIVVGPRWLALPADEQAAVLLHEVYHCRHLHMEVRALLFPLCWTRFAKRVARAQEFAADAFAARSGYGRVLIHFLAKHPTRDAPFHPNAWERVAHLAQL